MFNCWSSVFLEFMLFCNCYFFVLVRGWIFLFVCIWLVECRFWDVGKVWVGGWYLVCLFFGLVILLVVFVIILGFFFLLLFVRSTIFIGFFGLDFFCLSDLMRIFWSSGSFGEELVWEFVCGFFFLILLIFLYLCLWFGVFLFFLLRFNLDFDLFVVFKGFLLRFEFDVSEIEVFLECGELKLSIFFDLEVDERLRYFFFFCFEFDWFVFFNFNLFFCWGLVFVCFFFDFCIFLLIFRLVSFFEMFLFVCFLEIGFWDLMEDFFFVFMFFVFIDWILEFVIVFLFCIDDFFFW